MNHLEEAKLLAALLGVLKKESSKVRDTLLEELHSELKKIELPEPVLVEGPVGPQGSPGPQGPRGLLGEQGPAGSIGPKGDRGEQGTPGKNIVEAQLNDNGNLYLYRDDGVQFPIGNIIGEQGPIGLTGPAGPKGDKGDKGEPGLQGEQGEQGPQGTQGIQGVQGVQGDRGERGPRGDPGKQGPVGEKGKVGPKGEKGDIGPRGERGLTGLQGIPGLKGDKGEPGPQGEKGDPGKDGETPNLEPYLKKVSEETKKFQDNIRRTITRASLGGSSSGGGEVRLEFLDDVDRDTAKINGRYLKYDETSGKFVGATVSGGSGGSGDVSNTYLQSTFVSNTSFQTYVSNTNTRLNTLESGGGGDFNPLSVSSNIVPSANNIYDLGAAGLRWKDLFLSGQTINLGGATISSDGTGQIALSGTGAVLPANSRVAVVGQEKTIATLGESGSAERFVPLFTQDSGLTRPANTFSFRTETNVKVFTRFFLNSGDQIDPDAAAAQFLF